ncbi:NupC/NupG family nucleoside CNT transporter [Heyndrickxia acidiproducens]|uniref:NupC/NupG family nucleoside CNT transporter n=1 Tax=Heyndrickxia acidiproducens TaxID=1121084 RepID=UPI00036846FF|nr:nucleoside transporter C-terminal domain-containing protein [Heyndrickxia acidiproducens]
MLGYLLINVIGILVFIGVAYLISKNKQQIQWKSISIMLALNLFLAWFLISFPIGRAMVSGAAYGFNWLVQTAYSGIGFAFGSWVHVKQMDFFVSALLPILLVVPLFDILTYFNVLPWIIRKLGWILSKITGQPKFESFFSVEMMFLGNTEALAVSSLQIKKNSALRNLTLAMMSMSCISAAIVGAYTQLVPGRFVLSAIPLNIINAIIIANILNPVKIKPEEDTIVEVQKEEKEPFFSFLGDSILAAGKLILIIAASVISFVALAALIDQLLMLIAPWLTLESILGVIMFPFSFLLGLPADQAFQMAQYMGTKLVTNEFVVMGEIASKVHSFAPHFQAVLCTFLISFANFSTLGMVIGAFKNLSDKETVNLISKNAGYLIVSGILVSLLSAGLVGLFVW